MNEHKEESEEQTKHWYSSLSVRVLNSLIREYGKEMLDPHFRNTLYVDLNYSPIRKIHGFGKTSYNEVMAIIKPDIEKERIFKQENPLGRRGFIIRKRPDYTRRDIEGNCQFSYKNYFIDISKTNSPYTRDQIPVCIYHGNKGDTSEKNIAKDGFNTVEEAIDWINEQT